LLQSYDFSYLMWMGDIFEDMLISLHIFHLSTSLLLQIDYPSQVIIGLLCWRVWVISIFFTPRVKSFIYLWVRVFHLFMRVFLRCSKLSEWVWYPKSNLAVNLLKVTKTIMGKIMNLGNIFMIIRSPTFLAAIFWPNKCFFRPKTFTLNLMVPSKFVYNVFWMNFFPVVSIFRPKCLFLTDSVKN